MHRLTLVFTLLAVFLANLCPAQLVLQEILADPPDGFRGDANRDGERDPSDDAFVEFVNLSATALDVSGYQLRDATTLRHVFPAGTVVAPLQALVVFGGGTPTGSFGGAVVQTASTGGLSLGNSGDVVILTNGSGTVLSSYTYGLEGGNNTSLTRQPELTAPTLNALHNALPVSSGAPFSPGTGNDGFPYTATGNTLVRFMDPVGITGEDSLVLSIRVKLIQPSLSNATTVTITRSGGSASAADLGGFTSGTLIFPAGAADVRTLNLTVVDDALVENLETIRFSLSASGGLAAAALPEDALWLLYDNDLSSPLVFNEILADPPANLAGDANADGIRDPQDDEFIELVNTGASALDISGYRFSDRFQIWHRFPEGSVLQPQQAVVVFGGGEPTGLFGGSLVQTASEGQLSLTNSGDQLTLFNAEGNPVLFFAYDSMMGALDQSMNRNPDVLGAAFSLHSTIGGSGARVFSPGTRVNLLAFQTGLPTNVQFLSAEQAVVESAGTTEIPVGILFPSATSATSVQVRLISGNPARIGGFSASTLVFPAGSLAGQSLLINLVDDAIQQGNDTLVFALENATGGSSAGVGAADTFRLLIYDNDLAVPLVLNEIHADPADGVAGDANADGFRDPFQDEFLEWVNTSGAVVNMSGWKLYDAVSLRHEFPSGTAVNPGQALVVFGGGAPAGAFGGAVVQTASSGRLSLQNEGEEIRLENPSGNTVLLLRYGAEANADQSLNRSPELSGPDLPFALHTTLFPTALYSPGTLANGTVFSSPAVCSTTTPPGGLVSLIGATAVQLQWNPIPGSLACQVKAGPSTGGNRLFNIVGAEPSSYSIPRSILTPGDSYNWQVRCACALPPGPGDATAFSSLALFTVPLLKQSDTLDWAFSQVWYDGHSLWLNLTGYADERLLLEVLDASGRVMMRDPILGQGLTQISLPDLPAGVYLVRFSNGQQAQAHKMVVTR